MNVNRAGGLVLSTIVFPLLASCAKRDFNKSKTKGLEIEASNIETVALADLTQLSAPSPLHVPKGVIMAFDGMNDVAIAQVYQYIHSINKKEKLKGLEGKDQEITLVVVMQKSLLGVGTTDPNGVIVAQASGAAPKPVNNPKSIPPMDYTAKDASQLKKAMAQAVGLPEASALPHVSFLGTDEARGDIIHLWMKDWGEFFVGQDKAKKSVYGLLSTNHLAFRTLIPELAQTFKVPLIKAKDPNADYLTGDSAGNIMGTHDKRIIIGDSMSADLEASLAKHSLRPLIKIPTTWLNVGHVDEYVSIIPSRGKCRAALVHASPLKGFEIILNDRFDENDVLFATNEQLNMRISDLRASVMRYLKNRDKTQKLAIEDFSFGPESYTEKLSHIDRFVLANLWLEKERISKGVKIVQDAMAPSSGNDAVNGCFDETIALPQFFRNYEASVGSWEALEQAAFIAFFPDVVNMVVLRDYVIIPNPWTLQFQKRVSESLSKVIATEKILFADSRMYSTKAGELHCGTNVVRDPAFEMFTK